MFRTKNALGQDFKMQIQKTPGDLQTFGAICRRTPFEWEGHWNSGRTTRTDWPWSRLFSSSEAPKSPKWIRNLQVLNSFETKFGRSLFFGCFGTNLTFLFQDTRFGQGSGQGSSTSREWLWQPPWKWPTSSSLPLPRNWQAMAGSALVFCSNRLKWLVPQSDMKLDETWWNILKQIEPWYQTCLSQLLNYDEVSDHLCHFRTRALEQHLLRRAKAPFGGSRAITDARSILVALHVLQRGGTQEDK